MTEIKLPTTPLQISSEALFRHRIVSHALSLEALGEKRAQAIAQATETPYVSDTGEVRTVSRSTLYRWLTAYDARGIGGLEPAERHVDSKVLSEKFLAFLEQQKRDDSDASIPEIVRRARQLSVLGPNELVHRSTVWRAAERLGLPLTCREAKNLTDMRRWAYAHRMQMMLVDGKHFRAGIGRLRRVAFFFLDDCTRFGLDVVVGSSESTPLMLRGLFSVTQQVGLSDLLFADWGPGFKANDTHAVCIKLGPHFVHGRAHYPEGHGKIEAFNKTVHHDVLRGLARADVDPDFGSLELRLRHWMENEYNQRPHESLDGDSPSKRWNADPRELRFPADRDDLRSRFVLCESRHVTADNIVSVGGVHYEMPRGHANQSILVERHLLDHVISVLHEGKQVRLHPVNLAHNAEDQRATTRAAPVEETREAPLTAAAMAFARDFGPVTPPLSTDTTNRAPASRARARKDNT